jgi:polyferredoxin
MTTPALDPNHPTRWKHRRRMAYLAMLSMLALTGTLLSPWVSEARITAASDILSWFYFAMASIVGAYVGFATWADKK